MRIGFDIDGTITNFYLFIKINGFKFLKNKFKNFDFKINEKGYDLDEFFDIKNNLISNNYSYDDAVRIEKELLNEFWVKYYLKYLNYDIKVDIKYAINNLFNNNEIFIISSRKKSTENSIVGKFIKKSIEYQLKVNNIKYHHLLLADDDNDKIKKIKRNHIDIMVDDKNYIYDEIKDFTNAILIPEKYNKNNKTQFNLLNEICLVISKLKQPIKISEKITSKPSVDKVWEKHYHLGDFNFFDEKDSIYNKCITSNIDFPNYTNSSYFGKKYNNEFIKIQIDNCAKGLILSGIKKGDKVPVFLLNNPSSVITILSLIKIGVTIIPISPLESFKSIKEKLESYNFDTIFFTEFYIDSEKQFFSEKIKEILANKKVYYSNIFDYMPQLSKIALKIYYKNKGLKPKDDNYTCMYDIISKGQKSNVFIESEYDKNYIPFIVYTGGTIKPKAVKISEENLNNELNDFVNSYYNIKKGESILSFLPYDHIYGIVIQLLTPLLLGVEMVLKPDGRKDIFGHNNLDKFIIKNKVNYFAGIPVLTKDLMSDKMEKQKDLSNLKMIFMGSDNLSKESLEQLKKFLTKRKSNITILNGYGLTESSSIIIENGVPIRGVKVKIVEIGTNNEVGYDNIGELLLSSKTICNNCYLDEKLNKENFIIDNDNVLWFKTGDLASINSNGIISFHGRIKTDIIKINGKQVNTHDIESIIRHNKYVSDCLVFDSIINDKKKLNVLIKLKSEYTLCEDIINNIKNYCNKRLSFYENPYNIFYTNDFIYTNKGKIDKNRTKEKILRKEYKND